MLRPGADHTIGSGCPFLCRCMLAGTALQYQAAMQDWPLQSGDQVNASGGVGCRSCCESTDCRAQLTSCRTLHPFAFCWCIALHKRHLALVCVDHESCQILAGACRRLPRQGQERRLRFCCLCWCTSWTSLSWRRGLAQSAS